MCTGARAWPSPTHTPDLGRRCCWTSLLGRGTFGSSPRVATLPWQSPRSPGAAWRQQALAQRLGLLFFSVLSCTCLQICCGKAQQHWQHRQRTWHGENVYARHARPSRSRYAKRTARALSLARASHLSTIRTEGRAVSSALAHFSQPSPSCRGASSAHAAALRPAMAEEHANASPRELKRQLRTEDRRLRRQHQVVDFKLR